MSKAATAQALGVSTKRFRLMLAALPPLEWNPRRRAITPEQLQFIRRCAEQGMSRTATAQAVGIPVPSFRRLLKHLPAFNWPGPGRSVDARRAYAARVGVTDPGLRRRAALARAANREKHLRTVRGVTGTLRELVAHFETPVGECTIRARLRKGWPLDLAMFRPPLPPGYARTLRSTWEAVDEAFAGKPAPQCM